MGVGQSKNEKERLDKAVFRQTPVAGDKFGGTRGERIGRMALTVATSLGKIWTCAWAEIDAGDGAARPCSP